VSSNIMNLYRNANSNPECEALISEGLQSYLEQMVRKMKTA
jgi:hypothetical protein